MAIANIIAKGIGFNPGSVKYIPTHGFDIGTAIVKHTQLTSLTLALDSDLGTTLGLHGNTIPADIITTTPTATPPGNKGVCFKLTGGVVTIYVWDGVSAWVAK